MTGKKIERTARVSVMGSDFAVEKMTATLKDGTQRTWMERWLLTRSDALAERKQKLG